LSKLVFRLGSEPVSSTAVLSSIILNYHYEKGMWYGVTGALSFKVSAKMGGKYHAYKAGN
jgi:hypothetical protein